MPKFNVRLGRLVRETLDVVVEAPSRAILATNLHEVYQANTEEDWQPDLEWGCQESEDHFVLGRADVAAEADFFVDENGEVQPTKTTTWEEEE